MEFPPGKATDLTERIMAQCSRIMKLETSQYNSLYSIIYGILSNEIGEHTAEIIGFGFDDIVSSIEMLKEYQKDGKAILVVGSKIPYSENVEEIDKLALLKAPPLIPEIHFERPRRKNHERQPAKFGNGKIRRKRK